MLLKTLKLFKEKKSNISLPVNIKVDDKKLFIGELNRTIPESKIYFLRDIKINQKKVPLILNFEIMRDFFKFNSISRYSLIKKIIFILSYLYLFFLKKFNKPKIINKGLIIHDRHSENYFHWTTDVLPKLIVAKERRLLENTTIILPKFKSNFQLKSVQRLTNNKIFFDSKRNIFVKNLIYISELHNSGCPRKNLLKKIKTYFQNQPLKKERSLKIYISRSQSSRRKLLNEDQLVEYLKKKNFIILNMEKLNFNDQISLCSRASIIVSVHGAGLTNLLWMKKNTNIIEIRGPEDKNLNPYFVMCKKLKINYYYYLSKKNFLSNFFSHQNYKIDINQFLKEFQTIL